MKPLSLKKLVNGGTLTLYMFKTRKEIKYIFYNWLQLKMLRKDTHSNLHTEMTTCILLHSTRKTFKMQIKFMWKMYKKIWKFYFWEIYDIAIPKFMLIMIFC